MKIFSAVSIALILASAISAQTTNDEKTSHPQVVEQVDIRGNRRYSEADIKSWISTHKGEIYDSRKLERDARALFDTGHFSDVKVYVEETLQEGKIVTLEVLERPLIFDIEFEAIDPSQRAQVTEELRRRGMELSKGSEYDPVKIRQAAKIFQEMLDKQQADNLRVMTYVEQKTATEILVTFRVEKPAEDR